MAKSDRAAVDIDELFIDAEIANSRHGLGGEGFVQLPEFDVFDLFAALFHELLNGKVGAHAHDCRVESHGDTAFQNAHGFEAQFFGLLDRHDHHGGSSIVDSRSVSGGNHAAFLFKGGL